MITIRLNDEIISIAKDSSLMELLVNNNFAQNNCAVAVNRHFIPRSLHATILLQDNDVVEIVTAMQGG